MTNKQYDVFKEVLQRLQTAGVLDGMILVGSWCLLLYRQYFGSDQHLPAIRTRDMDFLVPVPPRFATSVDIPELLKDLGFITGYRGEEGYMVLQHPELMLEFLTPERGRGHEGPYDLPDLGVNAQPLRFMDMASIHTIKIDYDGIALTVPHPATFALHKLLVAPRRKYDAQRLRDVDTGVSVLRAVVDKGEQSVIRELLSRIPKGWQKTIRTTLQKRGEEDLLAR